MLVNSFWINEWRKNSQNKSRKWLTARQLTVHDRHQISVYYTQGGARSGSPQLQTVTEAGSTLIDFCFSCPPETRWSRSTDGGWPQRRWWCFPSTPWVCPFSVLQHWLADTLVIVGKFLSCSVNAGSCSGVATPPRRPWQCRSFDKRSCCYFGSMAMVGGASLRDKNTCARTLAENVGGAYTRRGAYMRDTTV